MSRYFYFKTKTDNYEHRRFLHLTSFKQYINELGDNTWNDLQSFYLEVNGEIGVSHVLRFENLLADWQDLTEELGLQNVNLSFKNRSDRDSDYMKYYDAETIQKVNSIYARDFEMLGYEMIRP